MSDLTDRLRCFDRQTCTEAAERIETLEAELAAMRAGGAPVAEMVPCYTPSGKRVAVISRFQHLPIGTKLYTHPQPAPTPQADSMQEGAAAPQAARDVLAERQRQISAEGWTPEHDDEHNCGEIAGAAGCYARHVNARAWVVGTASDDYASEPTPDYWPWDSVWWKPTNPRRDLVKAGALILAEIERIDRAARKQGANHD